MIVGIKGKLLDKSADFIIYTFVLVIAFLTLFPFWYCLIGSVSDGNAFTRGGAYFWPTGFTLDNYKIVLQDKAIAHAYFITILRTVIGTSTAILFTSVFAYAYSRKIIRWKKFYMFFCMAPMYFGGGLIPLFILYKNLHLMDNFLVYIIPGLFSFWNVIILQANFRALPDALFESATIDGASEYRIYWNIVMPLSKSVLAAIALFGAVGHWNSYFDSMIFTKSESLQVIQLYLLKMIKTMELAASRSIIEKRSNPKDNVVSETLQLATMMAATLPIIFAYPFLQRYFIKGMLVGSIKG